LEVAPPEYSFTAGRPLATLEVAPPEYSFTAGRPLATLEVAPPKANASEAATTLTNVMNRATSRDFMIGLLASLSRRMQAADLTGHCPWPKITVD
jgi:hypothetical protein